MITRLRPWFGWLLLLAFSPVDAAAQGVVIAPGAGSPPIIRIFHADGTETNFHAYDPTFMGGVRVALGDVNGDGVTDIITGAGPTGGPHVKVFSGVDASVLFSFYAYDPAFTGGIYVAAGDVDGDGRADIITGAGEGGGPHVEVFRVQTYPCWRTFWRTARGSRAESASRPATWMATGTPTSSPGRGLAAVPTSKCSAVQTCPCCKAFLRTRQLSPVACSLPPAISMVMGTPTS